MLQAVQTIMYPMETKNVKLLVAPPRGFLGLTYNAFCERLWPDCLLCSLQLILGSGRCPRRDKVWDHNTGDYVSYSYRIVSGFFNVPYYLISNKGYEMEPLVYSPYPRRLESLTICRCNCKGSTFSSVQTHDLSHDSPMQNQLSHQCTVTLP